jgi:hypothetical protein
MRKNRDELRRLHYINALFAHVTGRDLFLANQIKSAIAFSLSDLEERTAADPALAETYAEAFNAAAAKLLVKLHSRLPRHGFFHWDAAGTLQSGTQLFARAEVMAGTCGRRSCPRSGGRPRSAAASTTNSSASCAS